MTQEGYRANRTGSTLRAARAGARMKTDDFQVSGYCDAGGVFWVTKPELGYE
ncbi:hypothetical protein [uncultured Roseobacter sp.]|uniref:hypothetical protein n=1 Tax=uncultured Roseobacter sp. TaxID=114847 RepID=UPI00262A63EE|nr:hypothetical protein [uncultured Roseobacter sp.]